MTTLNTTEISIATKKAVAEFIVKCRAESESFSKSFCKMGVEMMKSMNPSKNDALYAHAEIKKMINDGNAYNVKLLGTYRSIIAYFVVADKSQRSDMIDLMDGASNLNAVRNYTYKSGLVKQKLAILKAHKLLDKSAKVDRIPTDIKKNHPAVAMLYDPGYLEDNQIIERQVEIIADADTLPPKIKETVLNEVQEVRNRVAAEAEVLKAESAIGVETTISSSFDDAKMEARSALNNAKALAREHNDVKHDFLVNQIASLVKYFATQKK